MPLFIRRLPLSFQAYLNHLMHCNTNWWAYLILRLSAAAFSCFIYFVVYLQFTFLCCAQNNWVKTFWVEWFIAFEKPFKTHAKLTKANVERKIKTKESPHLSVRSLNCFHVECFVPKPICTKSVFKLELAFLFQQINKKRRSRHSIAAILGQYN